MKRLWIGSLVAGAALSALSCTDGPTCGSGTIETDGECVAAGTPPGGSCAGNTTFDPSTGACIPKGCVSGKPCGICGANTTASVAADGTVTCLGTGGGDCSSPQVCPSPASGKVQICGSIYDAETSALISGGSVATTLKVSLYDAAALANTVAGEDPKGFIGAGVIDQCGRFTAGSGVTPPALGYIAVGTDDATTAFPGGNFIFTAMAVGPASAGQIFDDTRAFSAQQSLATEWGNNIIANGAYLGIYTDTTKPADGPFHGQVVPGVQLQYDNGNPEAGGFATYYFDDSDPLTHSMVNDAATETGMNGAGIMVGTQLMTNYTGLKTGCTFPELPAATLKNGLFVQEVPGTCP